jgi:hypothetical protein
LGSSALLPAGLGFRNKIINGDFGINQRNFTSTTTDNAYGFDRWFCYMAGATTTYSSQSFTAGNAIAGQEPTNHARVVTAGSSASNNYSIFAQKIEDVRTCAGQQVTVSFWAKAASGTPSIGVELIQNFGSGGSGEVAQFISKVTLSTSWVRYSVTGILPSISGKTIGTSSILILALWCSAGSDFNSRTGSIGIQNNTIDFWGVQVEQNYQPTPFEQRPIGTELALCQRYYQLLGNLDIEFIASTSVNYIANFPIFEMRATPTVTQTTYGTTNAYSNPTIVAMSRRTLRLVFVPISSSYARCIAQGDTGLAAEL